MKKFFIVVILIMLYIPGDVFSQGNTFDYYSVDPVFSYSGTGFDSTHVLQPSVVKKDGVYYMYYAGLPGANQIETGLATSSDGINWSRYPENPLMRCGENTLSPCQEGGVWSNFRVVVESVMYDEGIFKMWYLGNNKNIGAVSRLGYATSTDGITWNTYASNPIFPTQDINALQFVGLVKYADLYYLYYRSTDDATEISVATSSDGTAWSAQDQNPTIPGNIDSVHLLDNRIIALKNGYIGESKDGISFVFNDTQKVIDVDSPQISLVSDVGIIRAWYVDTPATFRAAIYYATAPVSILDTIQQPVNPLILQYMPKLTMYGDGGRGEDYLPMDVGTFVEGSALWDKTGGDVQLRDVDTLSVSEFESIVGASDTSNYYLAFSKPDTKKSFDTMEAKTKYDASDAKTTVYYRKMVDGDYTVLQYWYFYAMNNWKEKGGLNNHEGDWESVFVYLDASDTSADPKYVGYSAHHNNGSDDGFLSVGSVRRIWGSGEMDIDAGRPVSYVAEGSHANYPKVNGGSYKVGLKKDLVSGTGVQLGVNDFVQKTEIGGSSPFWMDYQGMWGADSVDILDGSSGPLGPKFNNVSGFVRFSSPVAWAGIDKIREVILSAPTKEIAFEGTDVSMEFDDHIPAGTTLKVEPYDEWISTGAVEENVVLLPKYWDITSTLENGTFSSEVTFSYDPAVVSELGGNENNLSVFFLNTDVSTWEIQESDVDTDQQTVSFETDHFSRYALGFTLEEEEISLEDLFDELLATVKDSSLQRPQKRFLVQYIHLIERFSQKEQKYAKRITQRLLKNLKRIIKKYEKRGYLSNDEKREMLDLINQIKEKIKEE